jgi:hypothetical protein
VKTLVVVLVVLVVLLVLALTAAAVASRRRRARLRARFGPEYDRVRAETGSSRRAEKELTARERRRAQLEIRPLPEPSRQRYLTAWTRVQTQFVDAPDVAVRDADRLVAEVLAERGYPTEDRDRLVGDLSVDHAEVLEDFRVGHEVYLRNERREATTEDLRRAMQRYRAVFERVIGSE